MKKLVSLLCGAALLLSLLPGCGIREVVSGSPSDSPVPSETEPMSGLPLVDEPITLSYWITRPNFYANYGETLNDTLSFQELERITGIHIDFFHPAVGNDENDFNLMVASRNYTDLISNRTVSYSGGLEAAVENGIYVDLKHYIEEYAPNYSQEIRKTKDRLRGVTTDKGYFAAFWQINDPEQGPWIGPAIRKDWLDRVGLISPVTVDDWERMLRAFRDEIGTNTPYDISYVGVDPYCNILSAYGVGDSFYRVGETVHFGPMEPAYFEYLQRMHQWYGEGLLNPSFYNRREIYRTYGLAEGAGAATTMYTQIGKGKTYNSHIDDPEVYTTAVPYPILKKGDKIHIRRYNPDIADSSTSITVACKDIVTAVRWMDYAFSEEGAMILNFGVEGQTYHYEKDKPVLSGLITENPDGMTAIEAIQSLLALSHPTRYYWWRELSVVSEEGADAIDRIWKQADADFMMPKITLSAEEGALYLKKMEPIEEYITEMTVKVILGIESADIYDTYVETLESMGIHEMIEIEQAALNRYLNR